MPKPRAVPRPSRKHKESPAFRRLTRELGQRVRSLRQDRGLTLEKAAEAMDLDLKHLQKVEAGDPPLNSTLATILRLAQGLKVTVVDLFLPSEPTPFKGGRRTKSPPAK